MAQTLPERILSRAAGRFVRAGDSVPAAVDWLLGTDATTPLAIEAFERIGADRVARPDRVILVHDHFAPPKDIQTANLAERMRQFAERMKIQRHFEPGHGGICHVLLQELGIVEPGDLVVGADSHTCTAGSMGALAIGVGSTDMASVLATGSLWIRVPESIQVRLTGTLSEGVLAKDVALHLVRRIGLEGAANAVIEFAGEGLAQLDPAGKSTLCNMASEIGAKSAMIPVPGRFESEPGACYREILEMDLSALEPVVACPYRPDNIKRKDELGTVLVDQVVIGSCTNGRIEDFRIAADILRGKRIPDRVRLLLVPGSQEVIVGMEAEGLLGDFLRAGAVLSPASCGPCMGGHTGVLAEGEVGLYTTNRNFFSRHGDPGSRVYLCSPRTAAFSALAGCVSFGGDR